MSEVEKLRAQLAEPTRIMDKEAGCGDNSCIFSCIRNNGGMRTNGGCRCFKDLEMNTNIISAIDGTAVPYDNREAVRHLQRSVMMLVRAFKGKT